MSIRVVNSYGNGGNSSAFFETLRDEIIDNDEDLRTSRLSSRPLERVFTETQASCPDVLTSFSWLFLYPVNYHVEWMRSDVKVDVGAIFHHAKEAFNENTLWNTHNQIVGMEVLYSHASGMMRLLEVLIQVMLAAILHKPHCFDDESRMAICKSLAGPINAVREKWRRLEYHTAWRGLFHHSPAYLLKNHVQEALDLCVNIVGSVRDLQLAMNALAARVEVTHNEKGQHSNGHVDGHYFPTWRPAEDSGGFIDFLYLYKAHFGEWHVDKGLLRGTVKLFVNRQVEVWSDGRRSMNLENIGILPALRSSQASEEEHGRKIVEHIACCSSVVDLGAGGGKYSEFLDVAFDYVRAYDAAPGAEEVTDGRVRYLNLGNAIEVDSADPDAEAHEWSSGSNSGSSTNPLLSQYDVTFCIEVAEHLPQSTEAVFLSNLAGITRHFLVISWSNDRENSHHLNPKPQEDVIALFHAQSCWEERSEMSSFLKGLSTVSWIKENILVFQLWLRWLWSAIRSQRARRGGT